MGSAGASGVCDRTRGSTTSNGSTAFGVEDTSTVESTSVIGFLTWGIVCAAIAFEDSKAMLEATGATSSKLYNTLDISISSNPHTETNNSG